MTREELLKLLEGVTGPDATTAPQMPFTAMPYEPRGLPVDARAAVDPMPATITGEPVNARDFMQPMADRREADIDAFMSGAPLPPATASTALPAQPARPMPPTAPTPAVSDAVDPLRAFLASEGARPANADKAQNWDKARDAAQRAPGILAGWQADREPQDTFLSGSQRERLQWNADHPTPTGRPLLPEQAPEPRTYAEAQQLNPMYRGELDPEAIAKLPGAPRPTALPRTYAEGATLPPEQRNDILARFAQLKQKQPAGDEIWSQFLGTLPGAPKAPSELDAARLDTERARAAELLARSKGGAMTDLDRARVDTERARAEELRRRAGKSGALGGGGGVGDDYDITGDVALLKKYEADGELSNSSAFVARLEGARRLPPKDFEKTRQAVLKDADIERRQRIQPQVNRDSERATGWRQEEDALREILPVLEAEAAADPDRHLPGFGNALQRAGRAASQWALGGTGLSATDTQITTQLGVAGQGQYRGRTGQVANTVPEQEMSKALYIGTGRVGDMRDAVKRRLDEIGRAKRRDRGGQATGSRTAAIRERRAGAQPSAPADLGFDPTNPLAGARP